MLRCLCAFALAVFGLVCLIDAEREIICQSDSQCDAGYCCMLGNYQNSAPGCKPRQKEGDACRPFEELMINRTHYFNSMEIELQGVHNSVCPCMEGLTCDKKHGVCVNWDKS